MVLLFKIVHSLTPFTIGAVAAACLVLLQVPLLISVPWIPFFSFIGVAGAGLLLVAYLYYSAIHWMGKNHCLAVMMLVVPFFLAVTPVRDIPRGQGGVVPIILVFILLTLVTTVTLWITGIIGRNVRKKWFRRPRVMRTYRPPSIGIAILGMLFFAWVTFTTANPGIAPSFFGTAAIPLIPGNAGSVWNFFCLPSLVPWAVPVIHGSAWPPECRGSCPPGRQAGLTLAGAQTPL